MAKLLRAVQPNAGVRAWYRKRLLRELEAMQKSVAYWLEAAYRSRESEIVGDASPARDVLYAFRSLLRRWERRWNTLADWLARRTVEKIDRTTATGMKEAFRAAGFTVKMDGSRVLNSRVQALIAENVNLIKSIARQYLTDVEGIVTRGVSMGKDLGYVTDALHSRYAITRRRAAFIARDQTDKASMAIQRTRDEQLGITEGIWVHLPGRKTSRPTHEAMDGKRFKLTGDDAGLYDSDVGRNVLPAELPGCYPEGSKLQGAPFAEKLFRRWYTGELTHVVTDNGNVFSVTPNHPILTEAGWVAAGLLQNGDKIIQIRDNSLFLTELNANGLVPTFDQLFEALSFYGISTSILDGSASDFHGDGAEGKVDIVHIDRLLSCVSKVELVQKSRDFGFSGAETACAARLLSGKRLPDFLFMGAANSPDCIMRRLRERLPVFLRSISIAEQIGLALITDDDVVIEQSLSDYVARHTVTFGNFIFTCARLIKGDDFFFRKGIFEWLFSSMRDNDASFLEMPAQSSLIHAEILGNSFYKNSFDYFTTCVIDSSKSKFSGHVYNLQTSLGWYISEKTVSRNCRCVYRRVIPEFGE